MTAIARSEKSERAVAAGVLLAASAVALWILLHRTPQVPLPTPRIEREEAAQTAPPPQSAAAQATNSTALAFEIVELPPMPAPRPAPQAAPPPPAQPAPPRAVPQAQAPKPVVQPQPEPPKPVVPVKAQEPPVQRPVEVVQNQPVTLLRPAGPQTATILPLHAEPERVREPRPVVAPMTPPPVERRQVTPIAPEPEVRTERAPDKSITPLAPEPERPRVQKHEEPREEPAPLLKPLPPIREVKIAAPAPLPHVDPPALAPKPVARPQPAPPAAVPAAAKMISGEAAGEGRVLLRMFEQGSGPGIEIRWPSDASEREQLYETFVRCFGMRIGIVDDAGHFYLPEGAANQPTQLNMDRYSGFVRRPEGQIASAESREIARVRNYHQGASGGPARIFPRNVDAFLIGGLRQAVGDDYLTARSIHAAYRLDGNRVIVDSIAADGHPISGAIDLSSGRGCR